MDLIINGESRKFSELPLSLATLVEKLGMKADRVAVELNRQIVRRRSEEHTSELQSR